MIALDTNVLVRFMVEDAEAVEQSRAARRIVLAAAAAGDAILLPDVVLCEFVWVLRRAYDVDRVEVAATLRELLATEHLVFESPEAVVKASTEYAKGPADFADYCFVMSRWPPAAAASTRLTASSHGRTVSISSRNGPRTSEEPMPKNTRHVLSHLRHHGRRVA